MVHLLLQKAYALGIYDAELLTTEELQEEVHYASLSKASRTTNHMVGKEHMVYRFNDTTDSLCLPLSAVA